MLFATDKDPGDGHVHLVEVDELGDGITDESGDPPHVHEVSNGGVLPVATAGYESRHPGPLVLVDDGSGAAEAQEAGNSDDAAMVGEAIEAIMEGRDPTDIAEILLFG